VPPAAAYTLISLRLPELTAVAEGQKSEPAAGAIACLTVRLTAGDEEAFRQFQSLYFDRLYRFLLTVARGDDSQAREALQETLVRVARHARRFDSEDTFWCWLKAIGRNAARDAGRKHSRYVSLLERFTRHGQPDPSPPAREGALAVALEESVGLLEAGDRFLIEGKYVEGRTVRELAAQMRLTEKAVESRLLRLRRQLREGILQKLKTL